MASRQERRPAVGGKEPSEFEVQAGKGPEYDYPTTDLDATIPVVNEVPTEEEEGGEGTGAVVGEDAPELTDEEIAREEELEDSEEWSEELAQNNPLPGEVPDPDLTERLPSDIGG